ncbi:MAG TPA: hypothetical protein VMT10_08740 [Solirubrobacteraceae bacterium]|nr:hypothetical protein [Solirubrobacteraceae bacterium]HVP02642.1 hypothetical protein [Solirubrobacteraceae bacterium]
MPSGTPPLLYLDQNYLSGIVKGKPVFRELEPMLRAAVERGAVLVPASPVHEIESAPRPELGVLELLSGLSHGRRLPETPGPEEREIERRLEETIKREHPARRPRASDELDLRALALALPRCRLITCDAFMADVIMRTRLDRRYGVELYSGRVADVRALRRRLAALPGRPA